MAKRPLYCDVCAGITEHLIDKPNDDDGDDWALCSQCGRMQPLPRDSGKPQPSATAAAPPVDSRTR